MNIDELLDLEVRYVVTQVSPRGATTVELSGVDLAGAYTFAHWLDGLDAGPPTHRNVRRWLEAGPNVAYAINAALDNAERYAA